MEAVAVKLGEPDQSLFDYAGYTEAKDLGDQMEQGLKARGMPGVSGDTMRKFREMDALKRANIAASYGIASSIKLRWIRFLARIAG